MPARRISVFDFAEFCEASPARQESVVQKFRRRSTNGGFDYYGPLKHLIRRTHWATDDLSTLERALPIFLSEQERTSVAENYRNIGEAYIQYWKERATQYFRVLSPRPDIEIGDLAIRVNPEVGMLTRDGDRQILKCGSRGRAPPVKQGW